jgi:MFS transporter, UMF1 family
MGPEETVPFVSEEGNQVEKQASYPGEDTSYTSQRELNGWYIYSWATEVFATICAAIFFPVNLEQLARENGVYAFDRMTPCTVDLGNITDITLAFQSLSEDKTRCIVHFLGITWMDSSSFALYTFSISTFLQTILVVSMSGAADYGTIFGVAPLMKGNFRKTFLLLFSCIALVSTVGFGIVAAVGPSVYILAALFAICSNVFIYPTVLIL